MDKMLVQKMDRAQKMINYGRAKVQLILSLQNQQLFHTLKEKSGEMLAQTCFVLEATKNASMMH